MEEQLEQVKEFQLAFGQNVAEKPQLIDLQKAHLRYDLGKEELDEYLEAVEQNDLVGVADALTDQLYILCGTILEHGMQHIIEDCFTEVQRSNLSKLDDNGKPIINGQNGVLDESRAIGKVLKSKNFREPNLEQFLNVSN
jgi:predicted HAD superfamily Cof-like phosphohydrolase